MVRFAIVLALLILTSKAAFGEPPADKQAPVKGEHLDLDGDDKIDAYKEQYDLGEELTLVMHERLDEESRAIQARATMISFQGTPFWTEIYLVYNKDRTIAIERRCPFGIALNSTDGKENLSLFDKDDNLIVALVREKSGRWAPVSQMDYEAAQREVETLNELVDDAEKNARIKKHERPGKSEQNQKDPR